jgi:hypothetical protein
LLRLKASNEYFDIVYNEQWLYDYFRESNFEKDIKKVSGFVTCAERSGASRVSFIME